MKNRTRERICGGGASDVVRVALALLLLGAAGLKGHQLTTDPSLGDGLLNSRWFLIDVVQFELLFGICLLSGFWRRAACRAIAILPLLLLPVVFFSGCSKAFHNPPKSAARSRMQVVDAGPVLQGKTKELEYDFRIVNTTDEVLKFGDVTKSCTCTSVQLDVEELAPSEETVLHLAANLGGRTGPFELFVRLDVDNGPPFVCKLKTRIYEPIAFEPKTLHFGEIEPGERVEKQITVLTNSLSSSPPQVDIGTDDQRDWFVLERVDSQVEELPDGVKQRRTRWKAILDGPTVVGRNGLAISTHETPTDSEAGNPTLLANWWVRSRYIVEPARVFFQLSQENSEEFVVRISRDDGKPVRVIQAKNDIEGIRCSVSNQEASATEAKVVVTIIPEDMPEFLFGNISLTMSDALGSVLRIPVAGSQ